MNLESDVALNSASGTLAIAMKVNALSVEIPANSDENARVCWGSLQTREDTITRCGVYTPEHVGYIPQNM